MYGSQTKLNILILEGTNVYFGAQPTVYCVLGNFAKIILCLPIKCVWYIEIFGCNGIFLVKFRYVKNMFLIGDISPKDLHMYIHGIIDKQMSMSLWTINVGIFLFVRNPQNIISVGVCQ